MRDLCSKTALLVALALGARSASAQDALEPPPLATSSPEPAAVEPPAAPTAGGVLPSFAVGAELGGTVPLTTLGSQVALGIELGYLLPVLDRRLELTLAAGWAPPQRSFTDGPYRAEVTQHELHFSLGPRYRLLDLAGKLNFSVASGARLYLFRSVSEGTAMEQKFLEYREQSTHLGFFLTAGGEYQLGPGRLFLDLDFAWAPLPHRITGDTSSASISPTLGYRLLF
jgi:hypothetical protein